MNTLKYIVDEEDFNDYHENQEIIDINKVERENNFLLELIVSNEIFSDENIDHISYVLSQIVNQYPIADFDLSLKYLFLNISGDIFSN